MKIAVYTIAKDEEKHAARWADATAEADYRLVVVDARTSDFTTNELAARGVTVVEADWPKLLAEHHLDGVDGFRFDFARNYALALLPDDIDLCVTVDMDETLDVGWSDRLRAAYGAQPFTKGFLTYKPGPWSGNPSDDGYPYGRVHARHGYAWVCACHEDTQWHGEGHPVEAFIGDVVLRQDELPPRRARSNYLPLLNLACSEHPDDARMQTYRARELFFTGADPSDIVASISDALATHPWPPEAAYLCRIAFQVSGDTDWLNRGCVDYPDQHEAWWAVAVEHHTRRDWASLRETCEEAFALTPGPWHYLANLDARRWGFYDFAALAAHHLGLSSDAIRYGAEAVRANPGDRRLALNLVQYIDGSLVGSNVEP